MIEFLRANGEQITQKKNTSTYYDIKNAIGNVAKNGIIAGASFVENKLIRDYSYNAMLNDVDNSRDMVSNVTGMAQEDECKQDAIYFIEKTIASTDEKISLANYFEKYGMAYLEFDTIKQNYHKFDYYKITSPDFILTDLEALSTFKNIFSNGVRVWHIANLSEPSESTDIAIRQEIYNLDYTRANIPMSIINGEGITI